MYQLDKICYQKSPRVDDRSKISDNKIVHGQKNNL